MATVIKGDWTVKGKTTLQDDVVIGTKRLASVAFSADYTSLVNKPDLSNIGSGAVGVVSPSPFLPAGLYDKEPISVLPDVFAPVALTGDFADLINKPTLEAGPPGPAGPSGANGSGSADWNAGSTDVGYIINKPDIQTLSAGSVPTGDGPLDTTTHTVDASSRISSAPGAFKGGFGWISAELYADSPPSSKPYLGNFGEVFWNGTTNQTVRGEYVSVKCPAERVITSYEVQTNAKQWYILGQRAPSPEALAGIPNNDRKWQLIDYRSNQPRPIGQEFRTFNIVQQPNTDSSYQQFMFLCPEIQTPQATPFTLTVAFLRYISPSLIQVKAPVQLTKAVTFGAEVNGLPPTDYFKLINAPPLPVGYEGTRIGGQISTRILAQNLGVFDTQMGTDANGTYYSIPHQLPALTGSQSYVPLVTLNHTGRGSAFRKGWTYGVAGVDNTNITVFALQYDTSGTNNTLYAVTHGENDIQFSWSCYLIA
jgi:hypothetical protein